MNHNITTITITITTTTTTTANHEIEKRSAVRCKLNKSIQSSIGSTMRPVCI